MLFNLHLKVDRRVVQTLQSLFFYIYTTKSQKSKHLYYKICHPTWEGCSDLHSVRCWLWQCSSKERKQNRKIITSDTQEGLKQFSFFPSIHSGDISSLYLIAEKQLSLVWLSLNLSIFAARSRDRGLFTVSVGWCILLYCFNYSFLLQSL